MDFLNHREKIMVFCQVFLLSPLQCTVTELSKYVGGCVSLKKYKAQGKAVEVTAVVGKHPDLMVGHPTSTVFPTKDRNFEISQFFAKNFEKV